MTKYCLNMIQTTKYVSNISRNVILSNDHIFLLTASPYYNITDTPLEDGTSRL